MLVGAVAGAAALVLAAGIAPSVSGDTTRATQTLNLRGTLPFVSTPTDCPTGMPEAVICHGRTGTGPIAGLGSVTETYVFMADPRPCPNAEAYAVLSYNARLSVEGKGELLLSVAGISLCIQAAGVPRASPQSFTVMGGTGIYAGASGSGTLTRVAGLPGARVLGADTWTGTLVVAGVDFDITPPRIIGAKARAVRIPHTANGARVTYDLTATDDSDGPVAVACRPPSGTRFKVGRTKVTCAATDKSGNTETASFTVTVSRRR